MDYRKFAVGFLLASVVMLVPFNVSFAETGRLTPDVGTASFADTAGHWGEEAIRRWSNYGIIQGCNSMFRPDDAITRGEMAIVLDNMMDYQTGAKNTFIDLKSGQFYSEAVLKANATGIIKGDGTAIRPLDKLTKEEAAVMLSRVFSVEVTADKEAFLDAASVSDWAKGAVSGMKAKGYISGYQGYFNPKSYITRAEAVAMIDNIVKAYYTQPGTYTEDIDGLAIIKVQDVTMKGAVVTGNLIIAEGVGQGDVYLDGVTIKGQTVIRGGGENSVHITGTSSLSKVSIQKVGDKLRIVVDDGATVSDMDVAYGEEIVISGKVGNVEIKASDVTVYATDAEVKAVVISGKNSKIIIGGQSEVQSVSVFATAEKTAIITETGAVVKSIAASAEISVSGTGTVSQVALYQGADDSSVTTPKTLTSVAKDVSGVTGGGGKPIPAGSTAANNENGTDLTPAEAAPAVGRDGRRPDKTVHTPALEIESVTVSGSEIPYNAASDLYTIPAEADKTNTAIDVKITNTSNIIYSVSISIVNKSSGTQVAYAEASGIAGAYVDLLSDSGDVEFDRLAYMFDRLGNSHSGWYLGKGGDPINGDDEDSFRDAIDTMFDRMAAGQVYTVTVTLTPSGGAAGTCGFDITKQ